MIGILPKLPKPPPVKIKRKKKKKWKKKKKHQVSKSKAPFFDVVFFLNRVRNYPKNTKLI